MVARILVWVWCSWVLLLASPVLGQPTAAATGSVQAKAPPASRDIYFDVRLRNTGTCTIHANVRENGAVGSNGATVLALHGFLATAATFGPLTDAIFADPVLGRVVRRVIAIDQPGHGESGLPTLPAPTRFTDLLIEDYVSVVDQSLEALRQRYLQPQLLMGQSLGGLVVQALQEDLLSKGSSLARRGIVGAILLAPVPARGSAWTIPQLDSLAQFVVTSDEDLGPYLDLPPEIGGGAFTTRSGTVVGNAPTAEQITANGWRDIEPLSVLAGLTGQSAPLWRPYVRAGAFSRSNGTLLAILSFSQDIVVRAEDLAVLYPYLTGRNGPLYRPIVLDDAVHGMIMSNPAGLVSALRDSFRY